MTQLKMTGLVLAVLMLSQVDARSLSQTESAVLMTETANVAALVAKSPKISPPLKDVQSDKKFFGPNGDYAADARPVPQKSIMDKLKSPDQPYPALQSKDKFDADYVKDENSDKGAYKAQFEYDYLRNKMAKEAADARNAGASAGKEGKDLDDAQKKADEARKAEAEAQAEYDKAKKEEGEAMQPEDFDDVPEGTLKEKKEKLEKLKKAVATAEAKYDLEKIQFEKCKKALEDAKTNHAELKAKEAQMEQKLAADTKLYVEAKTVRMNLQKVKTDAATSKRVATIAKASAALSAAKAAKVPLDKVLAEKKDRSAKAQQHLQKQKADLQKAQADMKKATLTLQKLRGYTPPVPAAKSSAAMTSVMLSFFMIVAIHFL